MPQHTPAKRRKLKKAAKKGNLAAPFEKKKAKKRDRKSR